MFHSKIRQKHRNLKLQLSFTSDQPIHSNLTITGSKSESNRLLLLQALYPNLNIENLSNSDDSMVMQKGLRARDGIVDIHHAGTAMRFLTAFFACSEGTDVVLTGSERMQQRPIEVLVDALRKLGADIQYESREGYPPIRIRGKRIIEKYTSLPANVSSQYISALLLVAASLENGLQLDLIGDITSVPYIKMTCALLSQLGIENNFEDHTISVIPKAHIDDTTVIVESDWSSASYFYGIQALSPLGSELRISSYREHSLQGDSVLKEIYTSFGVDTSFEGNTVILKKARRHSDDTLKLNLVNAPDLAQTIAVSCFGLGMNCELTGLHTLKIKETDRLEALKQELTKLGAEISVTDHSLVLKAGEEINSGVAVDTYNDHRMAMAFAPLALKTTLFINDAGVVSKSYPDFWTDLKTLGYSITEL